VGKGHGDDGGCILIYEPNGRITLRVSGVDMGQGFRTAMLQIAAEALDRCPEDFDLISGDTELTLFHGQAVSERQTLNTGTAIVKAAEKMKKMLSETPWRPGESRRVEYHHQAKKTYSLMDVEGRKNAGNEYRNYPALAYLTQCAVVEVDTATGEAKVVKIISVHDVGRAINPHIIEGQIEGSCSMGIGYALSEEYPMKDGYPKVKFFHQLGLPTIGETPEYELVLVEDPEPGGPFGAKGISEVATVPITPAIINAIYNAVGVRIRSLPARPERIKTALPEQASL
jgi:CO/xanthine dehydrogenase Mo-binding subunit